MKALMDDVTSSSFKNGFCSNLQIMNIDLHGDVNHSWMHIKRSLLESASASIPMIIAKRKRPWISNDTLRLIDARDEARLNRDYVVEALCCRSFEKQTNPYQCIE